ncbi:SubName: Full=Uncharacterized protein {ECO:0000313/EMBL:CCA73649.1} [Serendipita indica DSM 11827]|uniref:Uncharacterized protein n=1 Tax=Serendipita indica (strain DSM 11827) TaxID=1109443 RepID=G4TQQ6_SERID|nr:SubName: Full=Uncharacterized protein {ECO:0000313/EMBL:CCA73649.1} [Serendipita indica DSM 11827]CCA73649.1 hypothetical protein PIIN_07602 [Serendipita indica DSM 11827]
MSFSYGAVPPPDSPPLRAMPLSPAPARTDRRAKRQTTALSPSSIATGMSGLSLDDDPLDLNATTTTGRRSDSSLSRNSTMSSKRASAAPALPVPKMINSLPPNYQHPPSPAPSAAPSLSHSSSTHDSSSSCASSIKSSRAPRLNTAVERTNNSSDSLSSEPVTPTGTSFSRSRGKSISRAVGKLASDFLSLKGGKNKDRSEHPEPVPALPTGPFRK